MNTVPHKDCKWGNIVSHYLWVLKASVHLYVLFMQSLINFEMESGFIFSERQIKDVPNDRTDA